MNKNAYGKMNQKNLHTCVKSELLTIGKQYSFSFNPKEQPFITDVEPEHKTIFRQACKNTPNPFKEWWDSMELILGSLRYSEIFVYCEISSGGRFHFHGILEIQDIVRFLAIDMQMLKKNGSYEIDEIKDKSIWQEYVYKMQYGKSRMQEFLWDELKPKTQKRTEQDEDICICTMQ